MIRASRLTKAYEGVTVLDDASLEVAPGELVAIVGRSGSGKSTLLNLLGGLDVDYEGEVTIDGCPLKGMRDAERSRFRGRTIGFVFQAFNLLAPLTALENVLLPSHFGAKPPGDLPLPDRARACLERVGLGAKADRHPDELSGGERQRVAIARAIFTAPRVALCDEPTGALDAVTGGEVIDLFARLAREERLAVAIVTHEERVYSIADRVYTLSQGRLTERHS